MFANLCQFLTVGRTFNAGGEEWLCVGYVMAVEGGSLLLGIPVNGALPCDVKAVIALHSENQPDDGLAN